MIARFVVYLANRALCWCKQQKSLAFLAPRSRTWWYLSLKIASRRSRDAWKPLLLWRCNTQSIASAYSKLEDVVKSVHKKGHRPYVTCMFIVLQLQIWSHHTHYCPSHSFRSLDSCKLPTWSSNVWKRLETEEWLADFYHHHKRGLARAKSNCHKELTTANLVRKAFQRWSHTLSSISWSKPHARPMPGRNWYSLPLYWTAP